MNTTTHVEFRVIGPPGTGKTTWLAKQVEKAVLSYCERHGGAPAECRGALVSSLTKAAAEELRRRGVEIHPEQVRTLHAHAWHALGKPAMCTDGKGREGWNEEFPQYRFSEASKDGADVVGRGKTPGDRLIQQYQKYRARLTDRDFWPAHLTEFAETYETWKRVNHFLDFSDVIDEAWKTLPTAPGNPEIIFVDEAQDHDRAELRLVRKWAERCEKIIIVGDPDQNLYQWRGSDPEAFYEAEVPEENRRVLSQSWRVPRAVHAAAVAMIERIEGRERIEYQPRDFDGEVLRAPIRLTHSAMAGDAVAHSGRYLEANKTVMFLASCDYMIRPLCGELKDRGIPYWNPYAPDRSQFNPLHPSRGVSMARRMRAFLRTNAEVYPNYRMWTFGEFKLWTEVCYVNGLLRHGVSKWLEEQDEGAVMSTDDLRYVCESDAVLCDLLEGDPLFLLAKAKSDRRKSVEYAVRIFNREGINGLRDDPLVIVGTIHSVKGGEADVVYLAPDLSTEAWERFDNGNRDPIYRLMYVGMTRAKETLILCEPKTNMSVEW